MSTLVKRTLSSFILCVLTITAFWKGDYYFQALFGAFMILAVLEWFMLCVKSPHSFLKTNIWFIAGLGYILIAGWGFYQLRFLSEKLGFPGASLQILLIIVVAITDTAAYFTGKVLKGPKLAPAISPNKTWAGAVGGLVAAFLFAGATLYFNGFSISYDGTFSKIYVVLCGCISLIGQIGDLLESFVKRHFNVKDSGKLIPGHGGILDRTDGILAVSFVLGAILLISLIKVV